MPFGYADHRPPVASVERCAEQFWIDVCGRTRGSREPGDAPSGRCSFYVLIPVMCCGTPGPRVFPAQRDEAQHVNDRVRAEPAGALV